MNKIGCFMIQYENGIYISQQNFSFCASLARTEKNWEDVFGLAATSFSSISMRADRMRFTSSISVSLLWRS